MHLLYMIFIDPFVQMGAAPDLLAQTLWEGLVAGVLYSLIALGFVLIFKASGVFNFAQGAMVLLAGLALVRALDMLVAQGFSFWAAVGIGLVFAAAIMAITAWLVERFVLDVNDHYGTTIALIEHDMGVVMDLSDRVVVLDHGIKIADGTPDEIKRNQAVIDAYLGVAH